MTQWTTLSKLWQMVKDKKPGMLQSMETRRVGHDLVTEQQQGKTGRWNYICLQIIFWYKILCLIIKLLKYVASLRLLFYLKNSMVDSNRPLILYAGWQPSRYWMKGIGFKNSLCKFIKQLIGWKVNQKTQIQNTRSTVIILENFLVEFSVLHFSAMVRGNYMKVDYSHSWDNYFKTIWDHRRSTKELYEKLKLYF